MCTGVDVTSNTLMTNAEVCEICSHFWLTLPWNRDIMATLGGMVDTTRYVSEHICVYIEQNSLG